MRRMRGRRLPPGSRRRGYRDRRPNENQFELFVYIGERRRRRGERTDCGGVRAGLGHAVLEAGVDELGRRFGVRGECAVDGGAGAV